MMKYMTAILFLTTVSFSYGIESSDVVEGKRVRLECRFEPSLATSKLTYYWIRSNREGKDNAAIQDVPLADHYEVDFSPSDGRYDLIIKDADYNKDNGQFECKLKRGGSGSDVFSKVIQITVLIPPGEPQVTPSKPIAREGESFTLTCSSVGGSPDPMIAWSRDGKPLVAINRQGGSRDVPTTSMLTIDPKMEDDLSTYKCVVWNRALPEEYQRKYEREILMEVNYIPRVRVGPHNPLQVMEDSTVTMTCAVNAKPPARNVHWVFDGHIVSSAYNHTITFISRENAGEYKCVAENGVGLKGEAEIELQIMYAPKVTVVSRREVTNGESVAVKCNVDAIPKPHTVQWLKQGDPSFKQIGYTLNLRRVTAKNSGNYICQAINSLTPLGSTNRVNRIGNATLAVLIEHKPGKTEIRPREAIAIVGKPFSLKCEANPPGWPEPEYRWWRDERTNDILSRKQYLKFDSMDLQKEGKYFCQPHNVHGQGTVGVTFLHMHEPAKILTQLQSHVVREENEEMPDVVCQAVGKPEPKIQWLKDGNVIPTNSNMYTIRTEADKASIGSFTVISTISWYGTGRYKKAVKMDDRGTYTCVVDNGVSKPDSSEMNLHMRGSPKVVHRNNRVAFNIKDMATLECQVEAYPQPSFEWKRDKEVLGSYGISSRYFTNITSLPQDIYGGKLIIRNVEERDYGDYKCRSWNEIGDDTRTIIRLVRKGPPDTPTELQTLNVSFDTITLAWVAEFNGGYTSTEFIVRYVDRSNGTDNTYPCHRYNPCVVTGLGAHTLYDFSVKAKNPAGESKYSNAIYVNTKVDLKSIPEPLDVYFKEETSEVTFTIPENSALQLFAKVNVLTDNTWELYAETEPLASEVMTLKLNSEKQISDVRVTLCLVRNREMCGHGLISKSGTRTSKSDSVTLLYMTLIPGCILAAILLAALLICCCRKHNKQPKKDYEMENQNARPKAVTGPYYPDNLKNEGQTEVDGNLKNGIYSTNLSGHPGMQNGHISNGGLHYTDSSHLVSTNSSDNQSDLWIKANGNVEIPNGSYQHYDPPGNNGYMYQEDYPLNDDVMNQRNSNSYNAPYYDVSGLPDPYQHDEEEKAQQISFDESLESGYSTPNSRTRRVIREIIV